MPTEVNFKSQKSESSLLRHFHPPFLFVLGLALPAPLGRLVNAVFLFLVTLLLSLVHGSRFVFRRAVHRVEKQRRRASVDELMLCARRHDDEVARLYLLLFASHLRQARPRRECQDLVYRVDLLFNEGQLSD